MAQKPLQCYCCGGLSLWLPMPWWLACTMVVAAVGTVGVHCHTSIAAFVAAGLGAVGTEAAGTVADAADG